MTLKSTNNTVVKANDMMPVFKLFFGFRSLYDREKIMPVK
jgi:hypothetical protein